MSNIPQSRIILYLLIAGLIPIVFAFFYISGQSAEIDELENRLEYVNSLALAKKYKQSLNITVREHYQGADHFYVDKYLETLNFLKPEVENLRALVNNEYFAGDEVVKNRLQYLTGTENSMLFSEDNIQSYPFFQETTATLVHTVEVNNNDLKKVLALTEGQPIDDFKPGPDRPQILILDFKIDKKQTRENNDVFQMNLKLLKREYS